MRLPALVLGVAMAATAPQETTPQQPAPESAAAESPEPQTAEPVPAAPQDGDCSADATTLAQRAEDLLAQSMSPLPAPALVRAAELLRFARLLDPEPRFTLRAADLAAANGDEQGAAALLAEVAESADSGGTPSISLGAIDRLVLAAAARRRGDTAAERVHLRAALELLPRESRRAAEAGDRVRRLEIEAEARQLSAPLLPSPSSPARRLFAEARRALEMGRDGEARAALQRALRASPGYAEAALALGALERRSGRERAAVAAYRAALAADPDSAEAMVALSALLWERPDRTAKLEALHLADRAAELRPQTPRLLRDAAERWAEWGDAQTALARLDAYRRRATAGERRDTEALRRQLLERASPVPVPQAESAAAPLSAGEAAWRLAQAHARRGDVASLSTALELAAEAERLDPALAGRVAELTAQVHERRGERSLAETAWRRAAATDPSRAVPHERLAVLLERDHARRDEAEQAWRAAEERGSLEAAYQVARVELGRGRAGSARQRLERYLAEAPQGEHSAEAAELLAGLERARAQRRALSLAAATLAALALLVLVYRRFSGVTLAQWLERHPQSAREARPAIGRLRHELLKHGGLLLGDAAARIAGADGIVGADSAARRGAAELLAARLFGSAGAGLVAQARRALAELEALARRDGERLRLHRDPLLAPLADAVARLAHSERDLASIAKGKASARRARRTAARLTRIAAALAGGTGARLERLLDRAASTPVTLAGVQATLAHSAAEQGVAVPALEALGLFRNGGSAPLAVRVERGDWETIWRNLFANALAAGTAAGITPRLAVSAERARDPVTGAQVARFVLADDVPRPLTVEMIRGRAADRGLGIVADLVRRHEGLVDIVPAPSAPYTKGVALEFAALEETS